ncbi:LOW QUALITY PROTEIN: hypothetical protein Cgig2_020992 [Carnegiea gigantea]|uniref:Uncharacterized protein n=1 Tax=Carnegiea gigantea TaxID=171969 RepID=A0A9Q1K903_9CARY|nr:LOW QUALITY PROTEIN: hypothetical protein Cgig2_020992 [Carnegiea gigantea]
MLTGGRCIFHGQLPHLLIFYGFLTWVRLLRWVPAFPVADGEGSIGGHVPATFSVATEWFFSRFACFLLVSTFLRFPLQQPVVSVAAGRVSRWRPIAGDFSGHRRVPGGFKFFFFQFRRGCLKCSRARSVRFSFSAADGVCFYLDNGPCLLLAVTHTMREGCKRFVAIQSKSFDLAIVGTAKDVLKISENGRGRRTSLLLPKNVALWLLRASGRFFKSKSSNWCNQVRRGSRGQWDRGKQRVVTELGIRASSSVSTQVYSQRNSFENKRNRVHESNGSSSEGIVSVCANWPSDALLLSVQIGLQTHCLCVIQVLLHQMRLNLLILLSLKLKFVDRLLATLLFL